MARNLIRMKSTGKNSKGEPTGYFKVTDKNPKTIEGKLEKMMFDPRAINEKTGKPGATVLFKEGKI